MDIESSTCTQRIAIYETAAGEADRPYRSKTAAVVQIEVLEEDPVKSREILKVITDALADAPPIVKES